MQKYDVIVVGAGNPSPPAKVEMLLKYYDLMRVVPISTEEMLDRGPGKNKMHL